MHTCPSPVWSCQRGQGRGRQGEAERTQAEDHAIGLSVPTWHEFAAWPSLAWASVSSSYDGDGNTLALVQVVGRITCVMTELCKGPSAL